MIISKEKFQNVYKNVGSAFIALQTNMRALLENANCDNLKNACKAQRRNPGGAKLSKDLVLKISSAESSNKLFDLLVDTDYWSWIDIRLLEVMVTASQNHYARKLLDNYKDVFFSKSLLDVLPNLPSKEIKEAYYGRVVAKINKGSSEMTVEDLSEFQSYLEVVIMDIEEGICILEHLDKGCVEVYWYIPINRVDRAYQNSKARHCHFGEFHLRYLRIGHNPVIYSTPNQTNVTSTQSHLGNIKKLFSNTYVATYVCLDLFGYLQSTHNCVSVDKSHVRMYVATYVAPDYKCSLCKL